MIAADAGTQELLFVVALAANLSTFDAVPLNAAFASREATSTVGFAVANHIDCALKIFWHWSLKGHGFARLRVLKGQPTRMQCLSLEHHRAALDGPFSV